MNSVKTLARGERLEVGNVLEDLRQMEDNVSEPSEKNVRDFIENVQNLFQVSENPSLPLPGNVPVEEYVFY